MESLTQEQRALFVAGGQLDDYEVLKPIGKGKFSEYGRGLESQPDETQQRSADGEERADTSASSPSCCREAASRAGEKEPTTRAKEPPSPEETPPSSSRPPSSSQRQHKRNSREENSSSSSSRPPSSQRSTSNGEIHMSGNPEELKQKHLEARMELLFERLKLLQYGQALMKRISCKHFLANADNDRALPQVSPHTRFADLCVLVKWLLKLLGVDFEPETAKTTVLQSERSSPVMVAQLMLLGAERAGVEVASVAQISAPALTSGSGDEVCVLLDLLCAKALQTAKRSVFRFPSYPKETVEEMEAQDNLEIGADDSNNGGELGGESGAITTGKIGGNGGWGDSTTSTPGLEDEDDDAFAKWLVVKDERFSHTAAGGAETPSHRDQECEMIHSRIDPAAWRRELERIAPKLRDRMTESLQNRPKESSWHARVEIMQRNVGFLVSTAPEVRAEITQAQKASASNHSQV